MKREKEVRYGLKWLRDEGGLKGPYSGYRGYSLPQDGRVGNWSPRRRVKLCHSGWHFYKNTKQLQKTWGYQGRRWFLVEVEGPFKEDKGKAAGTRMRLVKQLVFSPTADVSLRGFVAEARERGLL